MSKLIKRAKLAGKILRFVPFLRMAALNGSIVRGEETPKSDIDFLIIAKEGRLYTCRAFATLLIHLTGWRRHGKKIAGRICLNCYLNDKNPNIFPHNKRSIPKVARAYKYLIPLVDDGISRTFRKTNKWFDSHRVKGEAHSRLLLKTCFRNFPLCQPPYHPLFSKSSPGSILHSPPYHPLFSRSSLGFTFRLSLYHPLLLPFRALEKILSGRTGDIVEQKLMNYQIRRILSHKKKGDELFADDREIRLHPGK